MRLGLKCSARIDADLGKNINNLTGVCHGNSLRVFVCSCVCACLYAHWNVPQCMCANVTRCVCMCACMHISRHVHVHACTLCACIHASLSV